MERKNKVRVLFIKILKILLAPLSRLRKLKRKTREKKIEIIVIGIGVTITLIALIAYLHRVFVSKHINSVSTKSPQWRGTPMKRIPLDELYEDMKPFADTEDSDENEETNRDDVALLHTPGCKIPLAMSDYRKYLRNRTRNMFKRCGVRAVFVRKHDSDKVIIRIKTTILRKFAKNNTSMRCCYKFIIDTIHNPPEHDNVLFSKCTDFPDGSIISLQSDFINIICSQFDDKNTSQIIYDDMYAFAKKIKMPKPKTTCSKLKYNVLIVGIESMSLPRLLQTMPRTVRFFKEDSWLGYQGYNKIADDTLPNLMAVLTGRNMSSIIKECFGSMDNCNYHFIWKAFKDAGYATAYGEDNFRKIFSNGYAFQNAPTDHYMYPFFLKDKNRKGTPLCTGQLSSGQQLLNYAVDFANTYKQDSFFGIFWINSFSVHEHCQPEHADQIIENFLNQLVYTGIMTNTFIIFLSTHGLRFGSHRLKMVSFYDDRMPMKFVWTPLLFKGKHSNEYKTIARNQHRLTTPYDVYSTLLDIKKISLCNQSSDPVPQGCPNCHSMFKMVNRNRTCKSAAIHEKWCCCHKLYPLSTKDPIGLNSVNAAVTHIQGLTQTIQTQRCWGCTMPSLSNVTRIHFYYDQDKTKTYYVVAITLSPGNGTYEVLVLRKDGYQVIGPISSISYYKGLGKCALNRRDRLLCVCEKNSKLC